MKYFRIHSNEIANKTQQPRGIFVSIWKLVNKNILTEDEIKEYWENRKWFEENLPIPPFYNDGNSVKAITWYKNNVHGNLIFKRMSFYFQMAKKYKLQLFKSECDIEPGKVIYEDNYQIGIIDCNKFKEHISTSEYCIEK